MEQIFKNNCTQDAFDAWLNNNGITPHPMDEERFYTFANEYAKNNENIDEKIFVKICKKYTHTSHSVNRGICQKYYHRLVAIVNFYKWYQKNIVK
jgi:hypothetical protein